MKKIIVKNLQQMRDFSANFAKKLKGGEIIGLVGELGAGKTTFVQFLARSMGVKEGVRSPTFILMQIFDTGASARKSGVRQLCHVDAYRLKDESELLGIGFDDYAGKKNTVTVVEWADRVPSMHTKPGYQEITFAFGNADERILTL